MDKGCDCGPVTREAYGIRFFCGNLSVVENGVPEQRGYAVTKGGENMNSPAEVAKIYVGIGAGKTKLPIGRMLILSIFAGMFVAFVALGNQVVAVSVEAASLGKFLGACVFPGGLSMVVVAGSELFTGNSLMVIPVMEKKATWGGLMRNWVVVYIGNFIGSILMALMVTYGHTPSLFNSALAASIVSAASGKVALSFGDAFIRGVLCNILVCIGVWMSFAATDVAGKILSVFFPIMIFVLCGYEHCIANMYFIPAGIFTASEFGIVAEGLTWGAFFKHLIPVTLGNIFGGACVVGLGYWAVYLRNANK